MNYMPRWNRIGSSVIDFFTVQMFGTLMYGFLVWLGAPIALTRTNIVLDLVIVYFAIIFLIFAATAYHYVTFRFFRGTLGKLILRVNIVDKKDKRISNELLLKREFQKWFLFYATLGLYGVYCAYCIMKRKRMYHENKTDTYIA